MSHRIVENLEGVLAGTAEGILVDVHYLASRKQAP